jgi:hypothetical protein
MPTALVPGASLFQFAVAIRRLMPNGHERPQRASAKSEMMPKREMPGRALTFRRPIDEQAEA